MRCSCDAGRAGGVPDGVGGTGGLVGAGAAVGFGADSAVTGQVWGHDSTFSRPENRGSGASQVTPESQKTLGARVQWAPSTEVAPRLSTKTIGASHGFTS